MDSVTLDDLDRGLIHALQIDGRASFSAIAEVLGASDQTIARRYRRLRSAGVLRVVGTVDGSRLGYAPWTLRLQCKPESASNLATALARRPETHWVHLLSGGTEISFGTQTRTFEERDSLLLQRLPRTGGIVSLSAHLMLRAFARPSGWSGIARLTRQQIERLQPPRTEAREARAELDRGDRALLEALARGA